jgi:DNA-binding FadR family transcriptional regulator
LEARKLIELHCFKEASRHITEEQFLELCAMEEEDYTGLLYMSLKSEFPHGKATIHLEQQIVRLQPNPVLTELHAGISRQWKGLFEENRLVVMPPVHRHRDHVALLNAIHEKNGRKIEKAVAVHLGRLSELVEQQLRENP